MRDRWDEEDELNRNGLRGRDRLAEPTLGESIDAAVRKVVTALVIAGGLVALGLYSSRGGGEAVEYQITSTADGTIYRLDSDSGRIVACRQQHCWRLLYDRDEIEDAPPAAPAAQPAPAQPQAVTQQPAPAQLAAPQNQAAPATR